MGNYVNSAGQAKEAGHPPERLRDETVSQSATDLSDGTIRFLLLRAILANPQPEALIAIDEPEVGLHPRMFPVIAEFAREASERSQVILTTHSPQFLDAFHDVQPAITVAQWREGQTRLSSAKAGRKRGPTCDPLAN